MAVMKTSRCSRSAVVSKISALSEIVLLYAAKSKRQDVISDQELNEIVSKTAPTLS
jgi:hypothetical protein